MAFALLSVGVLRREMLRLLSCAGMVAELDEMLITPLIGQDDSVRLVFQDQFVDITAHDRMLSLNDVSEKISANIIPISKFNSALARSVSAMHGV